jgi:hypothetical protein
VFYARALSRGVLAAALTAAHPRNSEAPRWAPRNPIGIKSNNNSLRMEVCICSILRTCGPARPCRPQNEPLTSGTNARGGACIDSVVARLHMGRGAPGSDAAAIDGFVSTVWVTRVDWNSLTRMTPPVA